jgi:hypothetical protein
MGTFWKCNSEAELSPNRGSCDNLRTVSLPGLSVVAAANVMTFITSDLRFSRCLERLDRGNRDNCLRSVICFLSRAPATTARYQCKRLAIRGLSKPDESATKGNIQPFKPLRFQEKLETQALFAFSRTAATTRTPQTKDSRYPVFIRGHRGCYQNNYTSAHK